MANTTPLPAPPVGSRAAGRRLWRAVLSDFELAEHELVLLREACRVAAVCDDLAAVVAADGVMVKSRLGEDKVHPALVELRQARLALARLIVALRLPDVQEPPAVRDAKAVVRSQRRALRGVYGSAS